MCGAVCGNVHWFVNLQAKELARTSEVVKPIAWQCFGSVLIDRMRRIETEQSELEGVFRCTGLVGKSDSAVAPTFQGRLSNNICKEQIQLSTPLAGHRNWSAWACLW